MQTDAPALSHVLIMTATVTPPAGAPGLTRVDPKVRLEDYRTALLHYLGLIGTELDAIVFAENSNADLSSLRDSVALSGHDDRVEMVVFDGMDMPPSYGRCCGEALILDHAMATSKIVAAASPGTIFWKITGRYRVRNLATLIRRRPEQFDLYCDLRNFRSPWADMRFMAWTKNGYERMFKGIGHAIREDTRDRRPGEEILYHELRRRVVPGRAVTCLTREPLIDGVRAYDNQNWSQGRQKTIYWLRQIQRIVFRRVFL